MSDPRPLPVHDFNELLHELRTRELGRLPGAGGRVLSGGCPDRWYFEWFEGHYASAIEEHVAVELFRDRPADLPANVRYVRGSLGDLAPVGDGSIDLVFAGQVIEHLVPDDLVGFLVHSHRVLRPGGHLVLDSPNRAVTLATGWRQPEHVLELAADEARELLFLAGFDVESVRGLWLCLDPATGAPLGFMPEAGLREWPPERRAEMAEANPNASLIWWTDAVRAERPPDRGRLEARVHDIDREARAAYFSRLMHTQTGTVRERGGGRIVTAERGVAGYLVFGPIIALPAGPWTATFDLEAFHPDEAGALGPDDVAAVLELAHGDHAAPTVVRERELRIADLPRRGERVRAPLRFRLDGTTFAVQLRVRSTGVAPLALRFAVDVRPAGREGDTDGGVGDDGTIVRLAAPVYADDEPTVIVQPSAAPARDLAAELGRRVVGKARRTASKVRDQAATRFKKAE